MSRGRHPETNPHLQPATCTRKNGVLTSFRRRQQKWNHDRTRQHSTGSKMRTSESVLTVDSPGENHRSSVPRPCVATKCRCLAAAMLLMGAMAWCAHCYLKSTSGDSILDTSDDSIMDTSGISEDPKHSRDSTPETLPDTEIPGVESKPSSDDPARCNTPIKRLGALTAVAGAAALAYNKYGGAADSSTSDEDSHAWFVNRDGADPEKKATSLYTRVALAGTAILVTATGMYRYFAKWWSNKSQMIGHIPPHAEVSESEDPEADSEDPEQTLLTEAESEDPGQNLPMEADSEDPEQTLLTEAESEDPEQNLPMEADSEDPEQTLLTEAESEDPEQNLPMEAESEDPEQTPMEAESEDPEQTLPMEVTGKEDLSPPPDAVSEVQESEQHPTEDSDPEDNEPPQVEFANVQEADKEISKRLDKAGAQKGQITISLMWHDTTDLDLYMELPSGDQVYWQRNYVGGYELDVDRNYRRPSFTCSPVENIFWTEKGNDPTHGKYNIWVENAKNRDGNSHPFKVKVKIGNYARMYSGTHRSTYMGIQVLEFEYKGPGIDPFIGAKQGDEVTCESYTPDDVNPPSGLR